MDVVEYLKTERRMNGRGIPVDICPNDLGYSRYENCVYGGGICVDCWNRTIEEAKE